MPFVPFVAFVVKITMSNLHAPIPTEVEKTGKFCLDAAFRVHSALGPGLLESVYEKVMIYELDKNELHAKSQVCLPITYDLQTMHTGEICDILVNECVILELKAVERMISLYEAQLLTYLKLSGVRLGYLINFNVYHLKDGIKRMVL